MPSVAQVTHSYFRRLPALGRFYKETDFFFKVNPLNLDFLYQAKNIPVDLPGSPMKTLDKSLEGLQSYDRIYKQTNRDYNYI